MDIIDFFRKFKYVLKTLPDTIRDSINEIDFIGTINEFINDKRVQKAILFVSSFLGILFLLFLFNSYMGRLDGPTVKNLKINNSNFGEITYSGDISNRKIIGKGLLTIIGNEWAIEYNGTFENNDSILNNRDIQIGTFTKGTIKIISLSTGNTYIFDGTFEDNFLKEGYIQKTINGMIVKYTGTFINNKLNGIGKKYIMINGESKTFGGVFKDNQLITRNL